MAKVKNPIKIEDKNLAELRDKTLDYQKRDDLEKGLTHIVSSKGIKKPKN